MRPLPVRRAAASSMSVVTAPMAMMPVVMVPPTPVPVPMPMMPVTMVPMAVMPVAMMMPTHLLGLQMIDIILGNDSRFHRLGA